VFRNVGIFNSDAGDLPRRKHTTFRTRRKFEMKNIIKYVTAYYYTGKLKVVEVSDTCCNNKGDVKRRRGFKGGERDVRKWCRLTVNLEDAIRRGLRRLEVGHFARTFVSLLLISTVYGRGITTVLSGDCCSREWHWCSTSATR
jgi:hypothetical protein